MIDKHIANMITDESPSAYPKYVNVVKDMSSADRALPSLIIGYERAKKILGKVSTADRYNRDKTVFWTYKRMENRRDYENDLSNFMSYSAKLYAKNVRYSNIDIINYRYSTLKRIVVFMDSRQVKYCYTSPNGLFMFIYSPEYNTVFGLSLSMLEYFGVKKDKVIERIKSNCYNRMVYNYKDIATAFHDVVNESQYLIPCFAAIF